MKADQTLRAPISTSWLVNINIGKNMQDDDLLELVKLGRLLSTVQVGIMKWLLKSEMSVKIIIKMLVDESSDDIN